MFKLPVVACLVLLLAFATDAFTVRQSLSRPNLVGKYQRSPLRMSEEKETTAEVESDPMDEAMEEMPY